MGDEIHERHTEYFELLHVFVAGTVELVDVDDPVTSFLSFFTCDGFHVSGEHVQCLVHHTGVFLLYGVGDMSLAIVPNDVAGKELVGRKAKGENQI